MSLSNSLLRKIVNQKSGIPRKSVIKAQHMFRFRSISQTFDILVVLRQTLHFLEALLELSGILVVLFVFVIRLELRLALVRLVLASDDVSPFVSNRLILLLVLALELINLLEKCTFLFKEVELKVLQSLNALLSCCWQILHHSLQQHAL